MTQQPIEKPRIKIYCAGKIQPEEYNKPTWREKLAGRVRIAGAYCESDEGWREAFTPWPVIDLENGYKYVGPYFTYSKHYSSDGPNSHGADPLENPCDNNLDRRQIIVDLCQQAIELCDIMFVWLDDITAYGTIAEIGYAAAFNKKIFIAGPRKFPDLWFSYQMAYRVMISDMLTVDCIPMLIEELYLDHPNMLYADYLKTGRWQLFRQHVISRHGNRCALCNSDKSLNVHHRTYENRGCEQSSDLIVLCRSCHAKFHDKIETRSDSGENW